MTESRVTDLRSVALNVPDLQQAEDFYTRVWQLDVVARGKNTVYLRGTGRDHHILSLHQAAKASLRNVTFRARSADELKVIAASAVESGGRVVSPLAPSDDPAGGQALTVVDQDGRVLRFVHGDTTHGYARTVRDRPGRLSHVVLNSTNIPEAQRFFETVMGLKLSDRTRIMAFLRCNDDHHCIALADGEGNSLNHIAFEMPDLDSVMRGGGRLNDAGFPIVWGPGRHGPGNNAFNYFVDPFGFAIEYTAEVQKVDDSYKVGGPDDWQWPPGRIDHWGISAPPAPRLKEAQKAIFFAPV
jgi:catechol 2,3-dioxygenase-like lactoylglutathione lyase family enzyme